MIEDDFLESEIIINGELKVCDIFPRITEQVITIYNFDPYRSFNTIKNKGPHFKIFYSESDFLHCLNARSDGFCYFDRKGQYVGEISDWHGYVAADTGPITRKISEYTMRMYFDDEHIDFFIVGQTGYVEPGSICKEARDRIKELGIYDFSVWFRVPLIKYSDIFSESLIEKAGLA